MEMAGSVWSVSQEHTVQVAGDSPHPWYLPQKGDDVVIAQAQALIAKELGPAKLCLI